MHGEASEVVHDGTGLLEGMPPAFQAARYHSLAVDAATLPPELRVTAMSEVDRVVMGIRHVALPLEGVQFHPESVLTPEGPHLLANFLRQAGEGEASRLDAASGSFATAGLAELELEKAALVGSSMGAATAMAFTLKQPERVPALVQVTPAYTGYARTGDFEGENWEKLAKALDGGIEEFPLLRPTARSSAATRSASRAFAALNSSIIPACSAISPSRDAHAAHSDDGGN